MEDIKQAAKWMQEGKRVIRKSERSLGCIYRMRESDHFLEMLTFSKEWVEKSIFRIEDLLADDWEMAE